MGLTAKQKVFKFQELDEETQQELIDKHRDDEIDSSCWFEFITDNWKHQLEILGFEDPNIIFSGFCSQGDGACFTALVDLAVYLPRHRINTKFKSLINEEVEVTVKINHDWRYCYSTSTDVNVELHYYGENSFKEAIVNVLVDKLEKHINDEREKLGNMIYKELQEWYEDLTSDECVKAKLCEYNFNELGSII